MLSHRLARQATSHALEGFALVTMVFMTEALMASPTPLPHSANF